MTGQGIDRRRFLRGLGLGAAAIAAGPVLAACGGGSSGLSGDQGGGGASGGASGAKPSLNVWYHQYGEAGTQQAVDALRQGVPGRHGQGAVDAGRLHLQAQQPVCCPAQDLTCSRASVNIDQVKSGQIVALDDIIADVKSDFTDADIKSSTVDGKIYQVKMVDDMGVLYYRKSILDKAGVQAPDHDRRADRGVQGARPPRTRRACSSAMTPA